MKILVIDDSLYVLKVIGKVLKENFPEADIITACDGEQGYLMYEKMKPDLMLTDLLMPGMSGQMLLSRVREKDKEVKIIVISADVQIATKLEVCKFDISGFINKPINDEKVVMLVKLIKEISNAQ